MSIALCDGFALSFAGQIFTQIVHPVQSSGATWSVYARPLNSAPLYGTDRKVAGACSASAGSYTLGRIAACGHTIAHLLHWMQIAGSHTGISSAMFRFSH